MSIVPQRAPVGERVLLHDVSWDEYTQMLRAFARQRSVRLTFDRGQLEIRSPRYRDDRVSRFLGRLVGTLTEELHLPIASGGSTTLRRRRRRRGLEPDECFWIANAALVRGRRSVNLRTDPPPDVAIEVDVTRSSLDRLAVYAGLGFPEVWRLDVPGVTFHVLQPDRQYAAAPTSRSFPLVSPADITGFLALLPTEDENEILRQFRVWVRQRHGREGTQ